MCRNGRNVNEFIFGDFPAAIRRDFLCAPLEFSLHIFISEQDGALTSSRVGCNLLSHVYNT